MSQDCQTLQLQQLSEAELPAVGLDPAGRLVVLPAGYEPAALRKLTLLEKAHLRAAYYWLHHYQPEDEAEKLEQVRGYLEAVHHLCELSAWESAGQVLLMRLDGSQAEAFHQQLGTWGYYREQIELYTQLLGRLRPAMDSICLNGLGYAHSYLGEFRDALHWHQQHLALARQTGNSLSEARALGGLSRAYMYGGQLQTATAYAQQQLQIAQHIRERAEESHALATLGYIANGSGEHRKALRYCHSALVIAQAIGEPELEWFALGSLGHAYSRVGQHRQAIRYMQQQLEYGKQTNDQRRLYTTLPSLALIYCYLGNYKSGIECLNQCLDILQQVGAQSETGITLMTLGILHGLAGTNHTAIAYLQQSLQIMRTTENQQYEAFILTLLAYSYSCLNQHQLAIEHARKALAIADRIQNALAQGLSWAALGLAYLQQGDLCRGLRFVARSLWILPPWKSADGRVIVLLLVKRIGHQLQRLVDFSSHDLQRDR